MPTTLSKKTIEWTLEHFVRHNDTDIFHKPFEFQAIYHSKDDFVKKLSGQDIFQWNTRTYRRCLVPKQRYGFRLATQLDPLDMAFYFGLLYEAGEKIENSRVKPDRKVSFSYRFSPDDQDYFLFDRNINFSEFQKYCRELADNHQFVVVTDIADFYPRIYLHRLENALSASLATLPDHAKAIIKLIKGWNQNVSYGIPVGNSPSRLLAEIVIDDIDRTLLAEGMVFTRYVDDFRIFCDSRQEAYKCLARLANALHDSHGLTLQAQKTKILTSQEFIEQVLETDEQKEISSLIDGFDEIIGSLGLQNPYDPIDYNDLSPEMKAKINGLNLESLLYEQLEKDEIDISMTKFLINRLGQLKRTEPLDRLLDSMDKLHPVLSEIIRYLAEIGEGLSPEKRQDIGSFILGKLQDSVVSNLEFNKMQIMSVFAGTNKWGNSERIARYYNFESDAFFRRAVILALGKSGQDFWLRTKKVSLDQMAVWDKRAFLYAASCFPKDEREHWYNAVQKTRDELERYIMSWASKNPITS